MHKAKATIKDGLAKCFIICFAISGLLIILFSLFSAFIVGALDDPTKSIGLFSLAAMILSAIVSGIICARIRAEGEIRFSCLVGLAVVLAMLLINVIISKGKVSLGAFMNYGCYLGAFTLSALLGRRRVNHRHHRH